MGFLKLACVSKIPPHILSDAKKEIFDTVEKIEKEKKCEKCAS